MPAENRNLFRTVEINHEEAGGLRSVLDGNADATSSGGQVSHRRIGRRRRRIDRPWGTWMVPALTPLMTSHSRLSFALYLGSQLRTGRCRNNRLLSLDWEHLTETHGRNSLRSSGFIVAPVKLLYKLCVESQLQDSSLLHHNSPVRRWET